MANPPRRAGKNIFDAVAMCHRPTAAKLANLAAMNRYALATASSMLGRLGADPPLIGEEADRLVEVKHWSEKRAGAGVLKKLVKVSIERAVDSALLLSTSGFTSTINSGLLEAAPPIRLGDDSKLIALCKTYYRLSTGYWLEEPLPETLHAGTILVPTRSG